jgi:CRP-like cAMP-binding protein
MAPTALQSALRETPLFAGFSGSHIEAVGHFTRVQHLEEGDLLFHEGEPCGAIYVVLDGLIKLYVTSTQDRERVIEFVEPGDSFAEAAMFSGQGYPVSAQAVIDARLLAVDAFAFSRYLRAHGELMWAIAGQLSRRAHYLVGRIRQQSLQGAKEKVAGYLLGRWSDEEPDVPLHGLPNHRADLAAAVGITVETLCRVLTEFRGKGWIETRDSAITLLDPNALEAVTGSTVSHTRADAPESGTTSH